VAEFDPASDHFGKAIAPLQQAGSRQGLEKHLGTLLADAARWSCVELIGKQIVLANAIQYQTSFRVS
jgi:hypothetical protein